MFSIAPLRCSRLTIEPTCSRIAARKMRSAASKPLGDDHTVRNVIRAQRLARCGSEHAKAEPRQFVPGEVPIAPIEPLRSDPFRIEIGRQNAERAVYMRQVGAVLVEWGSRPCATSRRASERRFRITLRRSGERLRAPASGWYLHHQGSDTQSPYRHAGQAGETRTEMRPASRPVAIRSVDLVRGPVNNSSGLWFSRRAPVRRSAPVMVNKMPIALGAGALVSIYEDSLFEKIGIRHSCICFGQVAKMPATD
jgi:hypothetical protein